MSIFYKVNEVREHIKQEIPELSGDRLIHMLAHCRRHWEGNLHYGRRAVKENALKVRELTKTEHILYDLLLRLKLNPSTAYRWFLATRVPDDIKEKLRNNQISQKKALEISANRKRVKESNIGLLMMEEIRTIMGGL
ncbi:hypothetical protein HYV86_06900 [Candidatus Woesearchaeota archaeon]|nr:hypothetical protein [Candidatus Woesearchaeota archaeon]